MLLTIPTMIVLMILLLLIIALGCVGVIFYAGTKKNIEKENELQYHTKNRPE